jgi:hypothetical protein
MSTAFTKPDLVMKEVQPPHQNWCMSGHFAPERFARNGTALPEEPTKFFAVASGHSPNVRGVYCEPCLIISNALARGDVIERKKR